jgi:hypothetical protein
VVRAAQVVAGGGVDGVRRLASGAEQGVHELTLAQPMARGWESKSVEAQQDAARAPKASGATVTLEEAARKAERATLMLARTRALADLQSACVPAHRAMLEEALSDLDRRLAALE